MDHKNLTSGKVVVLSSKRRRASSATEAPHKRDHAKETRLTESHTSEPVQTSMREESTNSDNLLATLLYRALENETNNDWNGTGTTFAGALVQILMGSSGTNGALSSYLLNNWLTHGAGADTIKRVVDSAIGSRLPPKQTGSDVLETPK